MSLVISAPKRSAAFGTASTLDGLDGSLHVLVCRQVLVVLLDALILGRLVCCLILFDQNGQGIDVRVQFGDLRLLFGHLGGVLLDDLLRLFNVALARRGGSSSQIVFLSRPFSFAGQASPPRPAVPVAGLELSGSRRCDEGTEHLE